MIHLGAIGGGGWLAGALLRPALADRIIKPADLVVSSRSGNISGFEAWPGVHMTTDNAILVDASDVILLSIRPADLDALELDLRGRFVISVMAGVTVEEITERFGVRRIVRAMPNACAEQRLSFTPWFATTDVRKSELDFTRRFFAASGREHFITDEQELDYFTALTGSGAAFPALMADTMIRHAIESGIDPDTADIAVRQLFLGAATQMASLTQTPADIVELFMEYRGTTAAGLSAMVEADLAHAVFRGLTAARRKALQRAD
jgi:pyrroline-5-carboxylate reductase